MKIILPPSETKCVGGDGPSLDGASLLFPELADVRTRVAQALITLCTNPDAAMPILGVGGRLRRDVARNAALESAPTMPAIERYTGVLFDALSIRTLRAAERRRADDRLMVGSALFGVVAATDLIPSYRLSASVQMPSVGKLAAVWRPALQPLLRDLAERELVVDLRSGAYQSLAPIPEAITARVLSEKVSGARSVVSHANKHTKGLLARALVRSTVEASSMTDVARVAKRAGLRVEVLSDQHLDIIVPG